MPNQTLTLTILFFLSTFASHSRQPEIFRVMSYNVENLFDTYNNPATNDNEFLPEGTRRWTRKRYYHKLQQIAKVIIASGQWDTPALIGLCEVENDSTLIHLLTRTPLRYQHYQYCITTGADRRGINSALLYQRDKFRYLGHTEYATPAKREGSSRNILHVWGEVINGHTLDIFVCHFPSRYGGEKESEPARLGTARVIRQICDSLCKVRTYPQLLIMGDFNDIPSDISMREGLQAIPYPAGIPSLQSLCTLYNLADGYKKFPGTHKYQDKWNMFDQIIVSQSLADPTSTFHIQPESFTIFAPSFLLTPDKTWHGQRPKRTYHGYRYEGGYSDHLPVLVDLVFHHIP